MRKGIIYIIKNKCNNKVYIGQTIQSLRERFMQHLKPSILKQRGNYKIYNAINKYGKDNFYIELLEENIDCNKLNDVESFYIEKYDSYKNGYNSTNGGENKNINSIDDIKKLKEMFFDKCSYSEIAKYFNVNKATICRTIASIGLSKKLNISRDYLLANKDIKTNIEMALEMDVSAATITRAFKRFNIKRGKGCSNKLNEQNNAKITKADLVKNIHLDIDEIAKMFNTSKYYIKKLFVKFDLLKQVK